MKKQLFIIAAALISVVCQAQITYSVNAGYDFKDNIATRRALTEPLHGFHIGATLHYTFHEAPMLDLTAGLKYRFATFNTSKKTMFPTAITTGADRYEEHAMSNAVMIPVRLNFNFSVNEDWIVYAILGPQLSYQWDTYKNKITKNISSTLIQAEGDIISTPTDYLPIDLTIGVGCGARYKHYFFDITYDQGVMNRLYEAYKNGKNNTNQLFTRELSLSIGYLF